METPVLRVKRIIIFGHRIELLKSFYVTHFNFKVIEEIKNQWVVITDSTTEIAFHKIGHQFEPAEGTLFIAESNTKIVFELETNLESFRQHLVQNGVDMQEVKSFEGIPYLFCDGADPEGNMFQLQQPDHV